MRVLPGDGGVCDALRYVRRGISASLDGQEAPAGANRNAANNLRGSSGCRSRPASTRNMALSAVTHVVRQVRLQGSQPCQGARGQGAPCAVPRALAGRGLALGVAPNCGLGRLRAYKDMRRCPVKHFQDFPRNPKTLGHAAQQQNKLHLGTRKPSHSPQSSTAHGPRPTAHSPQPTAPVTVCKSGAVREQGFDALVPVPSDWRWDSVSPLWEDRRHQGPAACPPPAICLAATSHPEKRLARSCCVDHGTKRLGDLCGSTYDYHDCHEHAPSSPAQPGPYLISASLAACLMLLSHHHVGIVNHSLALFSSTTQQPQSCPQRAFGTGEYVAEH